jgi:hypothetical protein
VSDSPLKEVGIGVGSSLIASALLGGLGVLPPPWAVAVGFALISLALSVVLIGVSRSKGNGSREILGLERVQVKSKTPVEVFCGEAHSSFIFWGISSKRTVSNPDLQAAIIRILRSGGDACFLLLDPDSTYVELRARLERESPQAWRNDILGTVTRLQELARRENIEIEIRYYDEMPVWRVMVADRRTALVNYFLPEKQGPQSPQLRITATQDGLLAPLLASFDDVWKRGRDVS